MTEVMTAMLCMIGIPAGITLIAFLCGWANGDFDAQAIEAFGQDASRLDGEATKARSEGCAQGDAP